ncbi:MAG TPA: methyltransferase domain-containing protein [Candidatus Acidoferrum sp.]|nr:methyltransferase domain-containing protein [Candidatus Acidoferrum sp.]
MGRSFDRAAERYDKARGGEGRGERFAAEIEPYLLTGTRAAILEIGVGTGVVAAALQRRGHRVFGADIAMEMLRVGLRRASGLVRYDGWSLPFASATFDAAYMVWVIHLVDDQRALLQEAARVLRPGGRLAIATINREPDDQVRRITEPMYRTLLRDNWRRDDLDRVMKAASSKELREVARAMGIPFAYQTSGEAEAARIEERSSSLFWDLADHEWREHVVPVIQRLRALGRVTIIREQTHEILVLEKSQV